MDHNGVLRRVRYALSLRNRDVQDVIKAGGLKRSDGEVRGLLAKEGSDDFKSCNDEEMTAFLDGVILRERGAPKGEPPPRVVASNNNVILRKLRIAFNLRDGDMLRLMEAGGIKMSKAELSALFRKPGHPHYRECGDQVLRYFLVGLTGERRPKAPQPQDGSAKEAPNEAPSEPPKVRGPARDF